MEMVNYLIVFFVLLLGIPIGNILAKYTKEELRQGQKWFRAIILVCLIGAVAMIFLKQDAILFSLLFIAIVTSRSLVYKKSQ